MKPTINDGDSLDLVRKLLGGVSWSHNEMGERRITVDQANQSVVVNEKVIVKWLVEPSAVPHPGVRVLAHLTEVGFTNIPKLLAVETRSGFVHALISEYIGSAVDGWDWYIKDLGQELKGEIAPKFVLTAKKLGQMCANLHLALAKNSSVINTPVVKIGIDREQARCYRLWDHAKKVATGSLAQVLHECQEKIQLALAELATIGDVEAIAVHGDLHVGQLLRIDDDLFLTDFDGDPVGSTETREPYRPATVDVASLMQSIDHVGQVWIRRAPDRRDEIVNLAQLACQQMLDSYRTELRVADQQRIFNSELLWPFRVAQELHEIIYASTKLPQWGYVPEGSLRELFIDSNGAIKPSE